MLAAAAPRSGVGPAGLDVPVSELELSTRARNCLRRAGISTLGQLVARAPSDLLTIVGFGQTSLAEVVRVLEPRGLSLREEPEHAARLAQPTSSIRTPEPAARREPEHAARLAQPTAIEEPILDRAFEELLAWAKVPPARRPALRARLGWGRARPCTLQEAGDLAGVTRERIRQIQKRFEARVRGRVRIPALERALELIRNAAPTAAARAEQILIEQGLAEEPLHPAGLLRLASLLGTAPALEVVELPGLGAAVVASGARARVEALKGLRRGIMRQARPFGFIHLDHVRELLAGALGDAQDGIAEIALTYAGGTPLGEGWFYIKTDSREPAVRLIEDMLAVAGGALPAAELAEGFARRLRWRASAGHNAQGGWYPPAEAIVALCRQRPERFTVEGDLVRATHGLDWLERITGVEGVMIQVLLEAPGHVLHRDDFERQVRACGVNPNTFSVYTSYSPFLRDLGKGLWGIRGVEPDPLEVERLMRRPRPGRRQVEEWRWLPDGRLRIAVRLRRVESVVVGVPSAIRRFLAGRTFQVTLPDGRRLGRIKVDEDGTSWGYGRPLRALGALAGGLMLADFDIGSDVVTLRVIAG